MSWRFLPLIGIALFFVVGICWRAWLQYRRHGHSGIILFRSVRWQQQMRDVLFIVLFLAAAAQAVAAAAAPYLLSNFYIVPGPVDGIGLIAGSILLFGGTLFMVLAQLRLGASWRIGIDEQASPGLVTSGLYSVCRNPIFLGMFILLAGLTVLLPTWISAGVFVGAIVSVRAQVLEEEAYLSATYGDAYRTYAGRVGRFLPGLGRLR